MKRAGITATLIFMLPFLLGVSGCPNAFSAFGKQDTDEARIFDMNAAVDGGNYARAIEIYATLSTAGQSSHDGLVAVASAYAGRCGLNLIEFADGFTTDLGSGKLMFQSLLARYPYDDTTAANAVADCGLARQAMLAITSGWTANDSAFLAFVELTRIGVLLQSTGADADNDGVVDGGFDPCLISGTKSAEIGSALMLAIASINDSGGQIGGSSSDSMAAICESAAMPAGLCNQTSPSDYNNTSKAAVNILINANEIGLNVCGNNSSDVGCTCGSPPP